MLRLFHFFGRRAPALSLFRAIMKARRKERETMTLFQYLSALKSYGLDVLLLALGVTLCVSLLKKTVLKNCSKKVFVFLPFALGAVFYGAFRAIAAKSLLPFTADFAQTAEGGFACGCAATLYYVVYEQFFRAKAKTAPPLLPLLDGIVKEEKRRETADALLKQSGNLSGEQLHAFVADTLSENALPDLLPEELIACANLICRVLENLRAK